MYEENKKLSLRDIIIQLALVILFVLILIWLFPTKGYLDKNYATNEDVSNQISEQLSALYGRLFADNLDSMKVAAQSYFTTPRLPKNVGDSVTLTLQDMLDKKMVLPFKDSNNKSCDTERSYVQLTKMDEEYQMKVQLSCTDYSDYIIVYMGCYSYCDGLCEAKPVTKPTTTKPNNNNPKPVVSKKYQYEYRLVTQNQYSNWSDWSNWSTTSKSNDLFTNVEIKTERVQVNSGNDSYGIIGYKTVNYIDYEYRTYYKTVAKEVATGSTIKVPSGTTQVPSTTTTVVDTKPVPTTTSKGYYTNWVFSTTYETTGTVTPTTTKKYEYRSTRIAAACSGCKKQTYTTYNVYTRKFVPGTTTTGSCSTYGSDYKLVNNQCVKYGTTTTYTNQTTYKDQPTYKTVYVQEPYTEKVAVNKTKQEPVYGTIKGEATYQDVTYYRYRTRTLISTGTTDTKWSTSQNDKTLLDKGYVLTGNKKEV